MTGGFVGRHRADEFDALVSSPADARDESAAERYADLLELVGTLRAVPDAPARPEFVADLRSRLVVAAAPQSLRKVDDATAARLTPTQRRGARERRLATVLGGFAVVAASGSMAMASQGALPGDVLYPVKRAIENAQTNLQSDDAAKSETLLAHAEQRLREVEALSERGDTGDADQIAATLQDFSEQANQATELALDGYTDTGDADAVDRLRDFTGSSMGDLSALGDEIPTDARPALITAAQTVQQADSAAFQVCPTCGDDVVTELPEFASSTVALPKDLLGLQGTGDTVAAPDPGYLEDVEEAARNTPQKQPAQRDPGTTDTGGPVEEQTDPGTEPADEQPPTPPETDIPATDREPNTLNRIGEEIKRGLGVKDSKTTKAVEDLTAPLVDGIGGLVDGLLGK